MSPIYTYILFYIYVYDSTYNACMWGSSHHFMQPYKLIHIPNTSNILVPIHLYFSSTNIYIYIYMKGFINYMYVLSYKVYRRLSFALPRNVVTSLCSTYNIRYMQASNLYIFIILQYHVYRVPLLSISRLVHHITLHDYM